jgi:hypothetical protein
MWRAFIRGGDIVISLGHRRALFGNTAFDARREACETVGEAFETPRVPFETPRVPFTRLVRSLTNLDGRSRHLARHSPRLAWRSPALKASACIRELMLRELSWKCRALTWRRCVPRSRRRAQMPMMRTTRVGSARTQFPFARPLGTRALSHVTNTRAHVARCLTAIAFATPLPTLPQMP